MSEQAGRYAIGPVRSLEPLLPGLLKGEQPFHFGTATLVHGDCFDWLAARADRSIHAVVTDPPYGLQEYTPKEQQKLRNGRGGVWRLPPSFEEFSDVSVLPRSMWEPWVLFRKPIEGRVQDNLRKWSTGGFRRRSDQSPFGDVIRSAPTRRAERELAPHPNLKPQALLRQLVRSALPLGEGVVVDPFAGSGATLAAADAVGYAAIGIEKDLHYFEMATDAIPALARITVKETA